jgi:hypothetical protein
MRLQTLAPRVSPTATRASIFFLAVGLGVAAGIGWSTDLTNWAYYGFLQNFLDPRAQIRNEAVGVALAFLAGSIHVVSV